MRREARTTKSLIAKRYRTLVLLAALLPAAGVFAAAVLTLHTGYGFQHRVLEPVAEQSQAEFLQVLTAEAARVDARLCQVSQQASMLAAYAGAVFKAPTAYTPHAPAAPPKPGLPAPKAVENPAYYVRGTDGALRKPVDDGQSAVFFKARPAPGEFTEYEYQQLYASAALDPLLKHIPSSNPLIASAYIATARGLIRIYPWTDLQNWSGTLDPVTKLTMCAYSKDKAGTDDVVWTKPYESKLSRVTYTTDGKKGLLTGAWTVACIAPIIVNDKVIGIAGCELDLSRMRPAISGDNSVSLVTRWLGYPEGMLLAAQEGAVAQLGATPIADAELAAAGNTQDIAFRTAQPKPDTSPVAKAWLDLAEGNVEQVNVDNKIVLVGKAKLPTVGWNIGAVNEAPSITAVNQYMSKSMYAQLPAMIAMLACLLLGVMVMLVLAGREARRITRPIALLATQARSVINTGIRTNVTTASGSEIDELSQALQELVNIACTAGPAGVNPTNAIESQPEPSPEPAQSTGPRQAPTRAAHPPHQPITPATPGLFPEETPAAGDNED